jgi:putative phage-type endonuclease
MNPHIERLQPKTRTEWLYMRQADVTASQIAALANAHPYVTALQMWQEKTGRKVSDDDIDNAAMRRGRLLEDLAFTLAAEQLPDCKLEHNDATAPMYWRDTFLRVGCTPDVLAVSERGIGVIELKAIEPSQFAKNWTDGRVPTHIDLQVQAQAHIVGAQWAAVGVLRVGHAVEFDLIEVTPNADVWHGLAGLVQAFWHQVETNTPPPPDFTRDGKAIAELVGASDGSAVDLSTDNELIDGLCRREEHKKLMGMLDDDLEAIDAMIRFKAGTHEIVTAGDFRLTLKTQQVAGYTVKPRTQRPIRQKRIRNEELTRP